MGGDEPAVEGVLVHEPAQGERFGVADAVHPLGVISRQIERRHQDGHQNRDNRYHDEQLNERKGSRSHSLRPFTFDGGPLV
jgi:hypothetical protein